MKDKIDKKKLPKHIAIIMDGNGRWAKKRGAARVFGHKNAIQAVRDVTEGCAELQVDYLTLYAFSTENWSRPRIEVNALMKLLVKTIRNETETLLKNNVKLQAIGDLTTLPEVCQKELMEAMAITKTNTGLTLILALSYSGRWDILQATQKVAQEVKAGRIDPTDINNDLFEQYLSTYQIPEPALLIRTSGEKRISNFMLWQLAYTELYVTDMMWPDFRKKHLIDAIRDYQRRERRFGKISEQIKAISE
ncbi:MAG: isoprenyl transferase [Bacteroidota bacterium]